ncbi:hypothetical protein AGDE_05114 [Angomonas deanei]|nr:hypothetical protein AGDE_05114 [Angomonas deanei]|eukprot:EPY38815.1 hypothetical protein AGDE_05114 [Angomonas deanei]
MRRSLTAAGVDLLARIEVGVINTQTSTLEAYLAQLLAHAERRPGLGPYRFNTSVLHHTLSLLHSVVGDDVQATRQLTRALASESRWESTYGDGRSAAVLTPSAEEEVGEPFQVSPLHIIDVGHLLPRLTAHSLAEVKDPFTVLVKKMEVEANQYQLVSSTVPLLSVERRLADIPTLAVPPRRPSTVDALTVGGYATLFLNSPEEAREALKRAVATIDPSRPRLYRTTRHLFKQYAQLCAMHPPRNRKLTQTGYEERKKWGSYLEARDIALGLFGSAQHARDVMKEIFYNDGELHRLRSPEVVERDCNDVSRIFFPEFASEKVTGEGSAVWSNTAKWHKERTTQPHLRCPSSAVPRHLWDTSVYNPYPHLSLGRSPLEHDPFLDGDDAADLFPDLWNVLTNPSVMGADKWYVQNTDMYVLLMRCLLYRLDWEAAVELTTRMLQHSTYTFLVDHEITMIFRDIGDPAGCLAFKVAAKLFDGRITRDGQTKREKYHDEQLR